jgi:NAD(P)-dependent dehydrogenase (short-subunit alcohol dehydrogenase family)
MNTGDSMNTDVVLMDGLARPRMNLSGKVVLVTGSTSGIGLGIARALAGAGANVVLNGFGDKAAIDKLVAEFKSQYNVKAGYSAADMSKPAEIAAMVAQAAASWAAWTSWSTTPASSTSRRSRSSRSTSGTR